LQYCSIFIRVRDSTVHYCNNMIFVDLHVGISNWRERWITQRNKRVRGVWDARLERETLILKDGRQLSYFIDGPLLQQQSLPHIFVFHAMFLSGNSFLMTSPPTDYVLVCINRPGYFGSDSVSPEYTYDSFAFDVEQLADHLGQETFMVAGHSSGGPCALACAACLPQRVRAVGILCGDPEYAHTEIPSKKRLKAFLLGSLLPFFLERVIPCLPLARNARLGLCNDYRLETSTYSFRTESVFQPTIVYLGEEDSVMPFHVSKHVHQRLDNAELRVVPKIGHLGLLRDGVLLDFFECLLSITSNHMAELRTEASSSDESRDSLEIS
jgi:pimeloyl-ACP methyl ester carboxylesterase